MIDKNNSDKPLKKVLNADNGRRYSKLGLSPIKRRVMTIPVTGPLPKNVYN